MGNTRKYCDIHQLEKQPYEQEGYRGGIKWYCPECKRVSTRRSGHKRTRNGKAYCDHLQRTYGLSCDAYQAMLDGQGGKCAICGSTDPGHAFGHMVVDHDHETGAVRGLLCHPCNRMLGSAKDNPETLEAAAEYIRRNTAA